MREFRIESVGQLYREIIMGVYTKRELAGKIFEQNKKIKSETAEKEFWHSAYKEKELTNDLLLRENQQLKQSQNSIAIGVLERLRNFYDLDSNSDWIVTCYELNEYINDQITELRGGENGKV